MLVSGTLSMPAKKNKMLKIAIDMNYQILYNIKLILNNFKHGG